jgi:hypothetical protein
MSSVSGRDPSLSASLEKHLAGSVLLGMELESRYRVLAVTLEASVAWTPRPELADDHRLQLLCHPVSTFLVGLRRREGSRLTVLTFEERQLLDVVAALEGPIIAGPRFDLPEPRPGEWGPQYSLEGRSGAPNGVAHSITLSAEQDPIRLDVFARFDETELRDAAGNQLLTDEAEPHEGERGGRGPVSGGGGV